MKIQAIEIVQPLGIFYVCSLTAEQLIKLAFPSKMREINEKFSKRDETSINGDFFSIIGTQRKIDSSKVRSVRDYIKTGFSCFPNSIILGANVSENGLLIDDDDANSNLAWFITRENFTNKNNEVIELCFINIPDPDYRLASIIDGQHRLEGFTELANNDVQLKMPLLCSVFIGLPASYQAHVFATINTTQKRVDRNVIYQLYQFDMQEQSPAQWAPDTLAVYIARVINADANSFFYGHFKIGADNISFTDKSWLFSMVAVTDGILRLISSNPKRDRENILLVSGNSRSRETLRSQNDSAPLREWYLNKKDKDLYDLICCFFDVIERKYIDSDSTIFKKTIGLLALFDVLYILIKNEYNKDIDTLKAEITSFFNNSCNASFFSNDFFYTSSKGRGRIKNTLLISNKMTNFVSSRVSKEEIDEIERILNS